MMSLESKSRAAEDHWPIDMDYDERLLSSGDDCSARISIPDGGHSSVERMRVCVAVATIGRAAIVRDVVTNLLRQTRAPDEILVVATSPDDVDGLIGFSDSRVSVVFSGAGLCRQRNRALNILSNKSDIVIFFDDDFVPRKNYIENVERAFLQDGNLVGATGWLIADGGMSSGFTFYEALQRVQSFAGGQLPEDATARSLYGCNMALRTTAVEDMRFDENLPLYGWLEDVDFTVRLSRRGRLLRSGEFTGVHMGAKSGKTSGTRLGYSQIANPLYLLMKNTVPRRRALRLIAQNILSNLFKSVRPESNIDRRGRLRGNVLAFLHVFLLRLHPRNVEVINNYSFRRRLSSIFSRPFEPV